MRDASHRHPYFLRRAGSIAALVIACAPWPAGVGALPSDRDPIGEGADELPMPVVRDAGASGPPEVIPGEVLTARPLAREREARLVVSLARGYLRATQTSVIENRGAHATPVSVAVRAPAAIVVTVRCAPDCAATTERDGERTIVVTTPELAPAATRVVVLELASPARRVAGNVRATWPPRGSDTRIERLRVHAAPGEAISVGGAAIPAEGVEMSPFSELRFVAREPGDASGAVDASIVRSPEGVRVAVRAPVVGGAARRVALLVDGSPSTLGPARNAIARAVPAILARLGEGSTVTVVRFGADATRLRTDTEVSALAPAPLVAELGDAAGTTTRLDRALALLEDADLDRVIVLGDGGLTQRLDDDTSARLRRLRASYVLLGARPASPALRALADAGRLDLVDARHEGHVSVTSHDDGPLGDRLETALEPRRTVVLRDGARVVATASLGSGETVTFALHALARPTVLVGGRRIAIGSVVDPVGARLPRPNAPIATEAFARGRDLPRETILEALRRQLVPRARLCLREDRRGRARHSVRTTLVVRLADREVTGIEVVGDLPQRLRGCLGDALEALTLPATAVPMLVRYPIHTLEADEPPVIELDEETRAALERAMGDEAARR